MGDGATQRGVTAPAELREAATRLVMRHGEVAASRELQISRSALLRLIAGLPVRRGTLALAEQQLVAKKE